MRSLFLKIFLSFWMTVVFIGVILVITTVLMRSDAREREARRIASISAIALPAEAGRVPENFEKENDALRRMAQTYEREGKPGLEQKYHFPIRVGQEGTTTLFFVTREGPDFFDHNLSRVGKDSPGAGLSMPPEVSRGASAAGNSTSGNPATVSPGSPRYALVLTPPQPSIAVQLLELGPRALLCLLAVLLVGGIFCFWLTRHITTPVVWLREAASLIAEGHLDTRVSLKIGDRRDEIAVLGNAFDSMAERIESLVASQRRLLGTVSHELRSPLARLSVALGLVRQCPPLEASEFLDRIELETQQLDDLISQFLMLARVDSGVDLDDRTTFDLGDLVQEVAANGNFEAQNKNCTVKADSLVSCKVKGAEQQLRTAFENIVRNAIKFTEPNSEIQVTMHCSETSAAIIQVRDRGPGVPDSLLQEIFRPFRRVPNLNGQEINGSGLGLAITERIVRSHGGSVRAENAPGGGLRVVLVLPLVE